MRLLVTGGSKFDPAVGKDLYGLGFSIIQAYGLTETSGAATINEPHEAHLDTVGKILPGNELKVLPREGDADDGEIAIRGPIVMQGYYNRPDATAEVMRDGWFLTGDLGRIDAAGRLTITGRKKEIIVLASGKNIYPDEIEKHYAKSAVIKDICVMGVTRPDEPTTERLHAVVVPDSDALKERRISNPATCFASRWRAWARGCPRTSACSATTCGSSRSRARPPASCAAMRSSGGSRPRTWRARRNRTAGKLGRAGMAGRRARGRRPRAGDETRQAWRSGAARRQLGTRPRARQHGARGAAHGAGTAVRAQGERLGGARDRHRASTGGRGASATRRRSWHGQRGRGVGHDSARPAARTNPALEPLLRQRRMVAPING